MAGVTFGNVANSNGAATLSPVVNMPASIVAGQYLLVAFNINTGLGTTATATGWSAVPNFTAQTQNNTVLQVLMYKIADGTEGSTVTFTFNNSRIWAANAIAISGFDPDNPIVGVFEKTSPASTTITYQSTVNPLNNANALLIGAARNTTGSASISTPSSGYTVLADTNYTGGASFNQTFLQGGHTEYTASTFTPGSATNSRSTNYCTTVLLFKYAKPTVALNTPANGGSTSDTTPELDFTGTDQYSNTLGYEIQVASDSGFSSVLLTKYSSARSGSTTFDSTGTYTPDPGVTTLTVNAWGGGGAGGGQTLGNNGGGGGGGGAYASSTATVTPGTGYTVTVGAGGTGVSAGTGNTGGDSWFNTSGTILAKGGAGGVPAGAGGAGGTTAASIGTTKTAGGAGGTGAGGAPGFAAGGGGSGGNSTGGGTGGNSSGVSNGTGGTAGTGTPAGAVGGAGGAVGIAPGSGGGGRNTNSTGAGNTGGAGRVIVAYSATADAGFADVTNGGDTDPFASGDQVGFTVQGGDALTPGTYYWRARAIDPATDTTYGPWSTSRSFTVSTANTNNFFGLF